MTTYYEFSTSHRLVGGSLSGVPDSLLARLSTSQREAAIFPSGDSADMLYLPKRRIQRCMATPHHHATGMTWQKRANRGTATVMNGPLECHWQSGFQTSLGQPDASRGPENLLKDLHLTSVWDEKRRAHAGENKSSNQEECRGLQSK